MNNPFSWVCFFFIGFLMGMYFGVAQEMKYSDFKVGDYIVRRYNKRVYRIANTADSSGQEFLIIRHPLPSKPSFSCEIYTNMRIATGQENTARLR